MPSYLDGVRMRVPGMPGSEPEAGDLGPDPGSPYQFPAIREDVSGAYRPLTPQFDDPAGDVRGSGHPGDWYPLDIQDAPLPNQLGDTGPTSFDYAVTWEPVYVDPADGSEFIGDLKYAPSLQGKGLQPVRWVQVPLTPSRVS